MADIFEIMGVDAKLKLPHSQKEFDFCDPVFDDKIALMKEYRDFQNTRAGLDPIDALKADHELSVKYIKLYLPKITDEDLKYLGDFGFKALHEAVTDMSAKRFGAYVRKIDAEKKDLATAPA